MDIQKVSSALKSKFPNLEIYQDYPLAPYTTVKIGGPADIFIQTKSSPDFKKILSFCQNIPNTPITILGNGSNVLISDSGIRGIVIKNNADNIELLPNNQIKVDSGAQLSQLINFSLDNNLTGLEEFAYIPSTLGGAIAGNIHGDNKTLFSTFLVSVEKVNDFIISAVLQLNSGNASLARQKAQDIIQRKTNTQPTNSLGSIFKNIPGQDPSGLIIDQKLNLKGYSIGDAQISPLHANFIINKGKATAKDYYKLIQFIQKQSKEKLNLNLEPEIKLLGQF